MKSEGLVCLVCHAPMPVRRMLAVYDEWWRPLPEGAFLVQLCPKHLWEVLALFGGEQVPHIASITVESEHD